MIYAFQDRENLYLIMDLLTGGDLRYHICQKKKFTEKEAKFILACLIVSLEYLHTSGVIHRDVKPENLVFDSNGYARLTDLGVARNHQNRIWKPDNSMDTSGTPGYMAPEVMCRQSHGVAADYYAVGVMAYEFMFQKRPYLGKTRKEIRDKILSKQVQIKKSEIPENWSIEATDFINRTIQRKPINRLGLNGPEEIKNHPWFKVTNKNFMYNIIQKDFPWDKLIQKQIESPFIPDFQQPLIDNFDQKSINNDPWKDENQEQQKQNELQLRRNEVQNLFLGYEYEHNIIINTSIQTKESIQYAKQNNNNNDNSNENNNNIKKKQNFNFVVKNVQSNK